MATVKLFVVAIFFCIYTFSRIIPTTAKLSNAEVKEKETQLETLTKTEKRWYLVSRQYRSGFEKPIAAPKKYDCTPKTIKFSKNNETLFLEIDNEKFKCAYGKVYDWDCELTAKNNGKKNGRNDVRLFFKNEKHLNIKHHKETVIEVIQTRKNFDPTYGDKFPSNSPLEVTKDVNC